MSDRFKFRAWYYDKDDENDSDNNKMFYDAQDTYDCLCGNPPIKASSFGCIVDDECWTVEQCTGLKDKNGRLIYENDLIKIDDDVAVIKWSDYYARFMLESSEDNFDFETTYAEECEIIGNIHENADLLENGK